jgi:hypothetical protein
MMRNLFRITEHLLYSGQNIHTAYVHVNSKYNAFIYFRFHVFSVLGIRTMPVLSCQLITYYGDQQDQLLNTVLD